MVRKTTVRLVDDLDGKPADETVEFGIDGVRYEVDLSSENAQKLRGHFGVWIEAARRIGGPRRRRSAGAGTSPIDREQNAVIRQWARRNGHEVGDRGRIATDVINAYLVAR